MDGFFNPIGEGTARLFDQLEHDCGNSDPLSELGLGHSCYSSSKVQRMNSFRGAGGLSSHLTKDACIP